MNVATVRKPRCRYHDRLSNPCTAEALEEGAEIMLCGRHLALAAEMFARVVAEAQQRHATQREELAIAG